MRARAKCSVVLILLLSAGCAATAPPMPPPACPVVPQLTLPDVQAQITAYIDSGRYDADVAAVAGAARDPCTYCREEEVTKNRNDHKEHEGFRPSAEPWCSLWSFAFFVDQDLRTSSSLSP